MDLIHPQGFIGLAGILLQGKQNLAEPEQADQDGDNGNAVCKKNIPESKAPDARYLVKPHKSKGQPKQQHQISFDREIPRHACH